MQHIHMGTLWSKATLGTPGATLLGSDLPAFSTTILPGALPWASWHSCPWTQEAAIQGQKRFLSADRDRKTPVPGGGLSWQHPAPTVYQSQVPLGKRRKEELCVLTHFSQSSLPGSGLAQ